MNKDKKILGSDIETLKQMGNYLLALLALTVTATSVGLLWGWLLSLVGIPAVAGYVGAACGFVIVSVSSVSYEVGRIMNSNLDIINKNIQTIAVLLSNMANLMLLNESKVVEQVPQVKTTDDIVH